MIKSVELFNFECHKNTVLEFDKGLNIFRGTSGAGKSSVKRALLWVLTNRPAANQVISWWNYDKKDKQLEETRVTVTLDDGTTISRIKSCELNGYQINQDKPLEAVGTSVPDEVTKLLNMSDINNQMQMAAPFLISQSAPYVAQYINDIVDMSDADYFQAAVESKRRKCNTDLDSTNTMIKRTVDELQAFDWLDDAETQISKIERIEALYDALNEDYKTIKGLVDIFETQSEKLSTYSILPVADDLVASIQDTLAKRKSLIQDRDSIAHSIELVQQNTLPEIDFDSADKLVRRITRIQAEQGELYTDVKALRTLIERYKSTMESIEEIQKELSVEENIFSMIDICPFCHSKIEGHECQF